MHVQDIHLVISSKDPSTYPASDLPEIALIGRSNVGKSSLINGLTQRSGIARTSSQPGKTQLLNFYDVDQKFRFVDVPGYGYARVSKKDRARWQRMIETYLTERPNLVAVFILMDFRHAPSDLDVSMYEFIDSLDIPFAVIATKIDKVKSNQHHKHTQQFISTLQLPDSNALFYFSAISRHGSEDIWEMIQALIEEEEDVSGGSHD